MFSILYYSTHVYLLFITRHAVVCFNYQISFFHTVLAKLTAHQFQLVSRMDVTGNIMSYDVASMILFGTHAIPVRMKILFDHLNAALMHSEIVQTLHSFGWTYQDYIRGYIAQVRGKSIYGVLVNAHFPSMLFD